MIGTNSLVYVKLSKTRLFKIVQSGGLLGRRFESLKKVDLPLMRNVQLIPLGLTVAAQQHIPKFIKNLMI